MGKGDRKTKKGKIIKGTYGVRRPKKTSTVPAAAPKKAAPKAAAKPAKAKKPAAKKAKSTKADKEKKEEAAE